MRKYYLPISWIVAVLMIIIGSNGYYVLAGTYEDPVVVINTSCGDTYDYGDTIEVEVLVDNADSYQTYGEGSFKAIKKSYTIKAGATGVKWHYTYDSGYEEPQGPADYHLQKTITADPTPKPSAKPTVKPTPTPSGPLAYKITLSNNVEDRDSYVSETDESGYIIEAFTIIFEAYPRAHLTVVSTITGETIADEDIDATAEWLTDKQVTVRLEYEGPEPDSFTATAKAICTDPITGTKESGDEASCTLDFSGAESGSEDIMDEIEIDAEKQDAIDEIIGSAPYGTCPM